MARTCCGWWLKRPRLGTWLLLVTSCLGLISLFNEAVRREAQQVTSPSPPLPPPSPPPLQNAMMYDPSPLTSASTTSTALTTTTTTTTSTSKTTIPTTTSKATTTTTTTAVPSHDSLIMKRMKRRMQERISRVRHRCEGRVLNSKNATVIRSLNMFVRSRIQVLEEHRLAICVVYKAGSTTWSAIVAHRYNNTKILQGRSFYKSRAAIRMLGLMQPTIPRFYEIFNSTDFARVIMARHPLTRLLSGYKEKLTILYPVSSQAKKFVPLILLYARNKNYTDEELYTSEGVLRVVPSFREFVSYLVSRPPEEYDPHWRPVTLMCGLCHVQYTAVVFTETYNEDMLYVMRSVGMDKLVDVNLLKLNNNRGPGDTRRLLQEHYSTLGTPLLRRIIDVYKDDMGMFGYTLDDLRSVTSELNEI